MSKLGLDRIEEVLDELRTTETPTKVDSDCQSCEARDICGKNEGLQLDKSTV